MISNDVQSSCVAPFNEIQTKEFIEAVLKTGALVSMLENKKINMTTLFCLLLERPDYQNFFTELTSSNTFKEAVMFMLYLNPSLVKSKITKSLIRKLNNGKTKPSYKHRKASLQ